jgi:hypothetical protein
MELLDPPVAGQIYAGKHPHAANGAENRYTVLACIDDAVILEDTWKGEAYLAERPWEAPKVMSLAQFHAWPKTLVEDVMELELVEDIDVDDADDIAIDDISIEGGNLSSTFYVVSSSHAEDEYWSIRDGGYWTSDVTAALKFFTAQDADDYARSALGTHTRVVISAVDIIPDE